MVKTCTQSQQLQKYNNHNIMFEIGYSDDLKKMRVKNIPSYLFENKKNKKIHGCSIVKNKKN